MSRISLMSRPSRCRRKRNNRRLRPVLADGSAGFVPLEPRLLLNASAESGASSIHVDARIKHKIQLELHHVKATHLPKRLTPAQEINAQYAAFSAAFAKVLNDYVQ